jgi:NitT/TauT family transport system substrate-binding protein
MTIATGVDPSFAPFYVARAGGFFQRNGLDVTVNTGPSGSAMIAFLIGNQINSAHGAEQAGVSAHLVDPNVVAVAEGTALLRWISVLGRNVASMDALRGKRVGVARGTGSETFWLPVLSRLNLNPADYAIVDVEAPEKVAAPERGNIDAFAV